MSRSPFLPLTLLPLAALLACGLPPEAEDPSAAVPGAEEVQVSSAAMVALDPTGTRVVITGTSSADTVSVRYYASSTDTIVVTFNGASTIYGLNDLFRPAITSITFSGGEGNDSFTNATAVPCTANGNNGSDMLSGGSGADFLIGDFGNDTLYGNAGADVLWGSGDGDWLFGGTENDTLFGHGGADQLYGEGGNDVLNGGSSNDTLYGDSGQDTIITVGLGTDVITGGSQWDYYWVDSSDVILDPSTLEQQLGYVHVISSFRPVSYNGGLSSIAVGLDPMGEDLPDPLPLPEHTGLVKLDFSDRVLFAAGSPNKNDIFQGAVGDCYMAATLSALADANPEFIRNMVVALGDGTYAVRFYDDGAPVYIRVDGDLWVPSGTSRPQYMRLGSGNSLWGPIIEKAYTIRRRNLASYASIATGDGTLKDHFNLTVTEWKYMDGLTKEQVMQWVASGSPSGIIMDIRNAWVNSFLEWAAQQIAQGEAVTVGSVPGFSDSSPIDEDSWRRGKHIYMLDRVLTDSTGRRVGIVLRDPYGPTREIRDFTRLFYSIGGAARWNLP